MKKCITIIISTIFVLTIILLFIANYYNPISYYALYGTLIVLGLLLFFKGIFCNDTKVYRNNIKLFFLIYFVALIFTIFLIDRRIVIDFGNIFNQFQLIPFDLLFNTLINSDLGFRQLIFNYIGNFSLLIPFALLLVTYNKKYKSYKEMFKTLFIFTFLTELSEVILGVGSFDIDDIILNILGGMLFIFLYNKYLYKLIDKVFLTNMNIKKVFSFLLCLGLIIFTCFLDLWMIKEIIYLQDLKVSNDYVRGLYANRQKEFTMGENIIYIDNLLVVYKHDDDMLEIDEDGISEISIDDIIKSMDYAYDNEVYEKYTGKDVNLYKCKNNKKLVFSNEPYKETYCIIDSK